uniref:Uncharacterized protein n=1 Tax=Aegilops tauschii TaxID=37682 RepID=M8BQD1_AEGTA
MAQELPTTANQASWEHSRRRERPPRDEEAGGPEEVRADRAVRGGGPAPRTHAASTGGYAVDGCREFIAEGEEGTFGALKCSACGCHRSFHHRVQVYEVAWDCESDTSSSSSSSS